MLIPLLSLLALFTAALSALLGMAGGMLFMAGLTLLLPVPTAMVLHGATQLLANGSRALLLGRHLRAAVLAPYLGGALLTAALLWPVRWMPDPAVVFLTLGLLPLLALAIPRSPRLSIERPRMAVLAGAVVTAAQLTAGVGGPLLDVFFVHSALPREEIVATKAATQVLAHGLKIAWFLTLADALPAPTLILACALPAVVGTALGGRLLRALPEVTWQRATRFVLAALGLLSLGRGLLLLA